MSTKPAAGQGIVTPVWETADHGVGFLAPPQHHAALASINPGFVRANLNREITYAQPSANMQYASAEIRAAVAEAQAAAAALPTLDLAELGGGMAPSAADVASGVGAVGGVVGAGPLAAQSPGTPEAGGATPAAVGGAFGASPPPVNDPAAVGGVSAGAPSGVLGAGPPPPPKEEAPEIGGPGANRPGGAFGGPPSPPPKPEGPDIGGPGVTYSMARGKKKAPDRSKLN